jgi:hypothetical protein
MGYPVNHGRIKPKAGAKPTAAERRHMARVAKLPCLVSGERNVTLHHVTGYADRIGRVSRSHQLVVPLAPRFHQIQDGPLGSVEALNHRGFFTKYGIDLMKEAEFLRHESIQEGIL